MVVRPPGNYNEQIKVSVANAELPATLSYSGWCESIRRLEPRASLLRDHEI